MLVFRRGDEDRGAKTAGADARFLAGEGQLLSHKKPQADAKKARGSSRGGRGAKARGSLTHGQGSAALAMPTPEVIPSFSTHVPPSPVDTPLPPGDLSHIPTLSFEDVSPSSIPIPGSSPPDPELDLPFTPPEVIHGGSIGKILTKARAPSVKLAGRDVDGNVIPHIRSEEVAKVVSQLAMLGHGENFICAMVNIRPGQLRKHYYNEFTHAAEYANAVVGNTAFQMANSGEDGAMTKFWLKAKANWQDGDKGQGDQSALLIHIHT